MKEVLFIVSDGGSGFVKKAIHSAATYDHVGTRESVSVLYCCLYYIQIDNWVSYQWEHYRMREITLYSMLSHLATTWTWELIKLIEIFL